MFRSLWETATAAGVAVSRYPVVAPTIGDIKRAIRPLPIVSLTEASPLLVIRLPSARRSIV